MADQLPLFTPKRSTITDCPRMPGKLCADALAREGGCPGAKACEEWPRLSKAQMRQAALAQRFLVPAPPDTNTDDPDYGF